jgi:hypothetical protein
MKTKAVPFSKYQPTKKTKMTGTITIKTKLK